MARKLQCARSVRKLLDAEVPVDPDIRQYGVYRIGNYTAKDMANYLIEQLRLDKIVPVALRYSYAPPRPAWHGGPDVHEFSAVKLYFTEKLNATEQVEKETQG